MKKHGSGMCAVVLGLTLLLAGCGKQDSGSYERAMAALESGDYTTAGQEFALAEKQDDRLAEVLRGEGILALEQEQYDEALKLFAESLDAVTGSNKDFVQDVQLYQAEAHLDKGEADAAQKLCQELLDGSRTDDAELLLGRIALVKGDIAGAEQHFQAGADKNPAYEKYLTIYELYTAFNMEANGAAFLEKALQLTPSNAEDFCSQGQVYYNLGQLELAKTSFARAIDLGNTDAVPMMGKLYLDNGEIQAARSMYQSYLKEKVRPALAYNGLALCDLADGEYDAALANISRGLEQGDAEVRESLLLNEIAAYEYKLEFQTAKAKMQAFVEEYPENKEAARENIFLQSR